MWTTEPVSVSRLVQLLRELTEDNFAQVLVRGEIANFSAPGSGHWYFTLKDDGGQLQAVMFRPHNRLVRFVPASGTEVIAGGRVSVYAQRGSLQLVVESLEPVGLGGRMLALEQLKARLQAEGLFDPARKRPLPAFPRTIGIVTSATGAALHDILTVLRRRSTGVRVILRPALVQGDEAAADIAAGIAELNRQGEAEVLIVGRGGGSLEDLWAFNEEAVVRAVAASAIPVISAVGHEVDTSLCDLAADLRAPTPSAAAELVVRHRLELESHLDHLCARLSGQIQQRLQRQQQRLQHLNRRLRSPAQQLALQQQRCAQAETRLQRALHSRLQLHRLRLSALAERLDALSPLAVLARGYAVVLKQGRAVTRTESLHPGDDVELRLHQGRAQARITVVEP